MTQPEDTAGSEANEPAEDAAPEAPILNREQRRALARGSKTSTTGKANSAFNHAAKAQTHGAAGPPRYPRTGHK
jgi:hypothetical protein